MRKNRKPESEDQRTERLARKVETARKADNKETDAIDQMVQKSIAKHGA